MPPAANGYSVQDAITIEERIAYLRVQGHPDPERLVGSALLSARLSGVHPVEAVRAAVALWSAEQPAEAAPEPPRRRWWHWRPWRG